MDFQSDDVFMQEDVDSIVKAAITTTLGDAIYSQKKVSDNINTIVDTCLKELQAMKRPFKYIVTCIIMQRNGAGMVTSATMFWDPSKDGHCVVHWTNKNMSVIVTVYGCSVNIDNPAELE